MLALWEGGLTLLGGIAGAVLINIPIIRRCHLSFLQVMDGAVIGLAFGIAFGRIGDLIIGDHLGKPTSWLLALQYEGGTPAGFNCAVDACGPPWSGASVLTIGERDAVLGVGARYSGRASGCTRPRSTTCSSRPCCSCPVRAVAAGRRLGVLTLTFGAMVRDRPVVEDFLRVDKRIFGLTGSQWTSLTVSVLCLRRCRSGRSDGGRGPPGVQRLPP